MHEFTDPTPTSLAGHQLITLFVPGWEIECCAPPPVVGHTTSWQLSFLDATSTDHPELDQHHHWHLQRRGHTSYLVDGAVTAYWSDHNSPPPRPGPAVVAGLLYGGAHGNTPADAPRVTGIVHRIRVVSQRFALTPPERLTPIPGTLTLSDRPRSPRWFRFSPDHTAPQETGVLLDLAVPRRP